MVTLRMRTGFSVTPFASAGDLRDALHHVHAFGDAAEGGILAVERRLRRHADEELAAVAVGLVGNADGGDDAALVLEVAESRRQQVQAAGAPEVPGGLRILEQRVAALDDAVGHHAVEGAAIVVALARELDELLHVLGRFVGRKFETERTHFRGDHGFEFGGRRRCGLLGPRSRGRKEQQSKRATNTHLSFVHHSYASMGTDFVPRRIRLVRISGGRRPVLSIPLDEQAQDGGRVWAG